MIVLGRRRTRYPLRLATLHFCTSWPPPSSFLLFPSNATIALHLVPKLLLVFPRKGKLPNTQQQEGYPFTSMLSFCMSRPVTASTSCFQPTEERGCEVRKINKERKGKEKKRRGEGKEKKKRKRNGREKKPEGGKTE